MNNPNPVPEDIPDGWHAWQTPSGHWWASRNKAYDPREESAGAWRTVDAEDRDELRRAIDAQEDIAARAWGRVR